LRERFPGVEVVLQPSGGGRFEVSRDGTPVFRKSVLKRHPHPGEIVRLLEVPSEG